MSDKASGPIVIAIHSFGIGGAESMVVNLANSLGNHGKSVYLIILHCKSVTQDFKITSPNVQVINLNKKPGFSIRLIMQIATLMRRLSPSILHTHLPIAHYFVIPKILQLRRLYWFHTFHSVAEKETSNRSQQRLNRWLLRKNLIQPIAITPVVSESIAALYGISSVKIPVISNGVAVPSVNPKNFRPTRSTKTLRLLHVGRFEDVKNHSFLVQIALHLKKHTGIVFTLTLVGDGIERESIEKAVKTNNLQKEVLFLGVQKNVSSLMPNYDLLVLPSKFEGQPMVILEAFAAALPVLATNLETLVSFAGDTNAIEFSDLDVNQFSEKIQNYYQNPGILQDLSESAFASATSFSNDRMRERYDDLFETFVLRRK